MKADQNKPLVIGLGNDYRSDDSLGHLIARKLAKKADGRFRVKEASGESARLLDVWSKSAYVIVVDAINTGCRPGTIHRMDAARDFLPVERFFHCSAYTFGLGEAILLAKSLHRLPRKLIIYAVEARNFALGTVVSPEVRAAVTKTADLIYEELRALREPSRATYAVADQ